MKTELILLPEKYKDDIPQAMIVEIIETNSTSPDEVEIYTIENNLPKQHYLITGLNTEFKEYDSDNKIRLNFYKNKCQHYCGYIVYVDKDDISTIYKPIKITTTIYRATRIDKLL